MTERFRRRLPWLILGLSVALTIGGLAFFALTGPGNPSGLGSPLAEVVGAVAYLAGAAVGALISSRRPRNPIGWIFCFGGAALCLETFAGEYAAYAVLGRPDPLPGAEEAAWISSWVWEAAAGSILTFLFLLFPDGRLPSPRWRPVAWLAGAGLALVVLAQAFAPGPLWGEFSFVVNPFPIERLGAVLTPMRDKGWLLLSLNAAASASALVVRLPGSKGERRQQLKWLVYASALVAVAEPLFNIMRSRGSIPWPVQALTVIAVLAIPLASGVAILRYHLYDIDIIIHRTLVYAALTAFLGLSYYGLVLLLQQIFSSPIADSQIAIAGSTLAVAALFRPARAAVQRFIDRHLYRRKYDAAKTLEAFSARLREEIDLNTLTTELLSVVTRTVQPVHVSLWLRSPAVAGTSDGPSPASVPPRPLRNDSETVAG